MKKIGLFLGVQPQGGGLSTYCQSLLRAFKALPADQYEFVVAYSDADWREHLKSYGSKSLYLRFGFFWRMLNKVWREASLPVALWRLLFAPCFPIVRSLLKERCNLWFFPAHDDLSYQAPLASVAIIHDLMHIYEPSFPEVSKKKIYKYRDYQHRQMCQWAKAIVTDSNIGKQHVHESYKFPLEKIFPLPYISSLTDSIGSEIQHQKRYSIPEKFLFYPARFWKHKNHLGLISAITQVKKKIPNICLVLVGSQDNEYAHARQMVNELNLQDNVLFVGYVDESDLAEFYRKARALVMPTFFGPTNIPQLEAFTMGCPVLTSRIYGIPEQVGDAALLFDPKSTEEMAACIERIWTDDELCRTLIKRGKERTAQWGQTQFNAALRQIIDSVLQ